MGRRSLMSKGRGARVSPAAATALGGGRAERAPRDGRHDIIRGQGSGVREMEYPFQPQTPKMMHLRFGANSPGPSPYYSPSSTPVQPIR